MKQELADYDTQGVDVGVDVDAGQATQGEPPEVGVGNGHWPTDDVVYYVVLKSRARQTLEDQHQYPTAACNEPLAEMPAVSAQCPRCPAFLI
eukprot:5976281-Pyramimonas_sp.AAC.1